MYLAYTNCRRGTPTRLLLIYLKPNKYFFDWTKFKAFAGNKPNMAEKLNLFCRQQIYPLSHIPILGSSNSGANKDIMSKIWTNGDTII